MRTSLALSVEATAVFSAGPAWAAATATHGAEEHGSWLTLMFFALNFALFVFALAYFALPLVRRFMSERAGSIKRSLGRAADSFEAAQELSLKAQERLERLEADGRRLGAEIDAETAALVRRMAEMADEAAAHIRRDAELSARALSYAARQRFRAGLARAATRMARETIEGQFTGSDQRRLVEGFVERLDSEVRG